MPRSLADHSGHAPGEAVSSRCKDAQRMQGILPQMSLRPSETDDGLRWIRNFLPEEQQYARLLLDSLHMVSSGTFRASLTQLLLTQIKSQQEPIAIYPIRTLPGEIEQPIADSESEAAALTPVEAPYLSLPGSEGPIGNIIRDVVRAEPSRSSSPESLIDIRNSRARTIILVDDYSGSGTRVLKYLKAWLTHRSVMSWYSYKLIRFHVVIGAISKVAYVHLRKHPHIEGLHFGQSARDFSSAGWNDVERENIEKLCRKYSTRSTYRLGFRKARGLFLVQHTVPNTLPMILWQLNRPGQPDWHPFFRGRVFPSHLQAELMDYKLPIRPDEIARSLRQSRLSATIGYQKNPTVQLHLLTLAACAHGVRGSTRIGLKLGISTIAAQAHVATCRELGLLDNKGRLTDAGRAELAKARTRPTSSETLLPEGKELYYPTQLRGVDDF